MPIIGSTTFIATSVAACTTTRRVPAATPVKRALDWSHSEVFVTPYGTLTALEQLNVPDLTTVHTSSPSCIDRWMLIPPASCGAGSDTANIVWSVNPTRSIVSNASYNECQLYGTATYSPGVCPSRQTVAEVTAYESNVSNGTRTFWQASCCRRSLLEPLFDPVTAYAAIVTAPAYDGEEVTPVYDYTSYYSHSGTTVLSNITTIATGLAVADPAIVAWQIDDVGMFPSEYVKSLVARYSVPAPASTSTPTTNALEPTAAPTSDGLSTSTQVGIGVGVALAAALVGGLLIFWCLRRRRKAATTEEPDVVIPEMEYQDHTHSQRKWYFGGRWRSEVDAQGTQNELDSKAVHVVPGPPAELEAHEPSVKDANTAGHNNGRPHERV